jgi:hypothetical protein
VFGVQRTGFGVPCLVSSEQGFGLIWRLRVTCDRTVQRCFYRLKSRVWSFGLRFGFWGIERTAIPSPRPWKMVGLSHSNDPES